MTKDSNRQVTDLDFESSQLQLVTDALRAGPGSPEWRAALEAVERAGGGGAAGDEYRLLYTARERLASGRQYREVRAGPAFTRKVFDAIEEEDAAGRTPRALPSANLIAAGSALVILGVLSMIVWLIVPRGGADDANAPPGDDLAQTYFVNRVEQTTFAAGLDAEWQTFGKLPVDARSGLRPAPGAEPSPAFVGGGAMLRRTMPADQPFALEASVKLPKPSDDVAVQVFVTDSAAFDNDRATTPHELVWLARGAAASVALPDGTIEAANSPVQAGQSIEVRVTVNRGQAAVEMNGRRLWSGPNQLDPNKPRALGLRFLTQNKIADRDRPIVESVRVLVPQKQ